MENSEVTQQIKSVYNGFKMSNEAISNYLDRWFDHLPTEGKSDVMGNYDAPEKDVDNLEFYEYELGEYEDMLWHDFSNSKVEMKVNDFKEYAVKYADRMTNNFTF
jgi:hypothetical protein